MLFNFQIFSQSSLNMDPQWFRGCYWSKKIFPLYTEHVNNGFSCVLFLYAIVHINNQQCTCCISTHGDYFVYTWIQSVNRWRSASFWLCHSWHRASVGSDDNNFLHRWRWGWSHAQGAQSLERFNDAAVTKQSVWVCRQLTPRLLLWQITLSQHHAGLQLNAVLAATSITHQVLAPGFVKKDKCMELKVQYSVVGALFKIFFPSQDHRCL